MARLDNIGKQFFDANGDPVAGGKLYFYETGTTTLATTYSDSAESSANTNPLILSADGRMGDVFYPGFLKIVLTDASDVVIETRDPVGFAAGSQGLPAGGTDGQALTKLSSTDYDVAWEDVGGGGWTYVGSTSASITAVSGNYYVVNATTPTVTLPASPSQGDRVAVRNINTTDAITLATAGGVTIDSFDPSSLTVTILATTTAESTGITTEDLQHHATLVYLTVGGTTGWWVVNGQIDVTGGS